MFSYYSSPLAETEPSPEANSSVMIEEDNNIIEPQERASDQAAMEKSFPASPSSPPSSWNEAHSRYCQKHGVLRARIRDVVKDMSQEVDYELPWELPTASRVATSIQDLVAPPPQSSQAAAKPVVWQRTKQLASSLVSAFFQDELEDSSDWQDANDHAMMNESSTAVSSSLDWDLPIIDVDFTNQCLEVVKRAIQQRQRQHSSIWILTKTEWKDWCSSQETDEFLAELSSEDMDWLLEVLVEKQQAKIVKRDHLAELVVLNHELRSISSNGTALDVAVALHDLKHAQQKLEYQMQDWANSIQDCHKKALQHKRQNQTSLAVMQLKKSKLLQQRIDSSTQALLTLEQTQATIEMTHSNQVVLQILAQSNEQLRKLTQQTPIELVETIKEELQLETEEANEIQGALTASNYSIEGSDEEALWKELQSLTLEDPKPADNQETMATPGSSSPKVESKVPKKERTKAKKENAESSKVPVLVS
jgi:hypothetical protein